MTEQEQRFKDKSLWQKLIIILGMSIFVILVFGFVLGIYFVGFAGLFQLLGVEYASIWSLVIFVVLFYGIGFIVDLFVHPMTELLQEKLMNGYAAFLTCMALEVSANWMILHAVNALMESVTISAGTEWLFAFFIALVEYALDSNSKKK